MGVIEDLLSAWYYQGKARRNVIHKVLYHGMVSPGPPGPQCGLSGGHSTAAGVPVVGGVVEPGFADAALGGADVVVPALAGAAGADVVVALGAV